MTSNAGRGGRRYLPYAFTEQGVAMLSTVLKSKRAITVDILRDLESRVSRKLATHDQAIADILKTIRELLNPPVPKNRPIGFTANLDE